MKDLIIIVLVLIAGSSIALNFVLANKVNFLRSARKSDKEMAQLMIASAVRAASEIQKEINEKEKEINVFKEQINIAIDVVENLQNKIKGYEEDIKASSHIHNKLYELLTQRKIVKRIWNSDFIEYYDINTMSLEEVHDLFGHPVSA